MRSPIMAVAPAVLGSLVLGAVTAATAGSEDVRAAGGFNLRPRAKVGRTTELLVRGREIYEERCAPCHGTDGGGDGPAAYLLYPRPRDFVSARYRFVSTWERVPTDEDLFYTISRGVPGSSMPSWAHLTEEERWALVHYVKSFTADPWDIAEPSDPSEEGAEGTGVVSPPTELPDDEASRERGKALFAQACAPCHGPEGRGDGPQEQRDERGYPLRPRDLNTGVYKGSPDPEELFRHIVVGLPGTPMPAYPIFFGDMGWDLVHYVRSLSSDAMRERAEMKTYRISAPRIEKVPDHPDDGMWRDAAPVDLHLMPLWWRYDRPEYLTVRALHDGNEIALLLVWADETADDTVLRHQDFRDAAAVQFSLSSDPPFFAMGASGQAVNIWLWKADRQRDLAAFSDLETQYPNIGIDSYPNLERSPLEQLMRHALTLDSDPTFVTGWGAGNIVSDPERSSAAEDLAARGFGTLQARPATDKAVFAKGVYSTGSYRVLFKRSLKGKGPDAVGFKPGEAARVSFAIWDGEAGDRDGQKSVSIWQELVLER